MKLIDSQTYKNLAQAYASECQARTRYEFAEYGARYNGFTALSEIIDKIVYNEFNHARVLYTRLQQESKKEIEGIQTTGEYPFKEKWDVTENMRLMEEDEKAEMKLYEQFAKTAKQEGFDDVANLFTMLRDSEESHAQIFAKLYRQMKDGTMYHKKQAVTWQCGGCGYTQTSKDAWETCPLCNAKQGVVLLHLED